MRFTKAGSIVRRSTALVLGMTIRLVAGKFPMACAAHGARNDACGDGT